MSLAEPVFRTARRLATGLVCAAIILLLPLSGGRAGTLDTVRERGMLNCGVGDLGRYLAGTDGQGRWVGFFPDLCRAVAAAVLKDPEAVNFMPASLRVRLDGLKSGEMDVLMTPTTWTLDREADQGLSFPVVVLYDGQGFLAESADVGGAMKRNAPLRICAVEGTTSERNLTDDIRAKGRPWTIVPFKTRQGRNEAMLQNRCDVLTGDRLDLVEVRELLRAHGRALVLLPDTVSREPVGPTVRQGDPQWVSVVRWVIQALMLGEEKGITAAIAADPSRVTGDDETMRLLGRPAEPGVSLGLEPGWAVRALAAVGNYGELFDRYFGAGGLKLERGANALWRDGGLLYPLPFR